MLKASPTQITNLNSAENKKFALRVHLGNVWNVWKDLLKASREYMSEN